MTGPYAQDFQAYLGRHKISSQTNTVAQVDAEADHVILDETPFLGADLIVMGAYRHGRLRQMIFGAAAMRLSTASPVPMSVAR